VKTLLLAFTMNLVPAAPLDVLRFLRVPAIVWVLRRRVVAPCRNAACAARLRRNPKRRPGPPHS
jgi:hypothetical protein